MWPNFEGGSIVDLMDSVARARGGMTAGQGLRDVVTSGWRDARTVVLLVLDGVGMKQLELLPDDSFLRRNGTHALTSVFPSTTAAAITTFMTARAPAVHGLTGWHVRFDEPGLDGRVLAILPVTPRGSHDVSALRLTPDEILARVCRTGSMFGSLPGDSCVVSPADIVDSPFNRRHSAGARRIGHNGFPDMLDQIDCALRAPSPPSYVYAYWPDFDHCAHQRGATSDEAGALLRAADAALSHWVQAQPRGDTLLLVTADHGFIDGPPQRLIDMEDLPPLADCLAAPLSGERRAVFCHVKPGRERDFERAAQALDHACTVWRSADLQAAGRFGPGAPHPKLLSRVGDFTLEMGDDWTLRDKMPGERRHRLVGVHGGTHADEMTVPLVQLVI
ncbi:MAG: alkaline phosphatase family protein [Methyloversatilis sp.]|nr:alkaline phosphatase family protein [Methyloversatilis sp.]